VNTERDKVLFEGPAIAYLVVTDVAACRDFWAQTLGFVATVENSKGNELDFMLLNASPESTCAERTPLILEYQRYTGLSEPLRRRLRGDERAVVYVWLARGLEDLRASFEATHPDSVIEVRTAAYGADEVVVSDPHGHVFIFGERHAAP